MGHLWHVARINGKDGLVPRHHIVPQMTLRRFADEAERIVMIDRGGGRRLRTKVHNACAESGFYVIPSEELQEQARDGHDPELVEKLLANIEGSSKTLLDKMVQGYFPLSLEDKFHLSLFLAIQMARGWAYREDIHASANILLQHEIQAAFEDGRIRTSLKRSGQPYGRRAVERYKLMSTNLKISMKQAYAVQSFLRTALDELMPRVYFRSWRLLRFTEPSLLTSDNPFCYWTAAGAKATYGIADAPVVYYPIDRSTALAMHLQATAERVSVSGEVRASQINLGVASEAEKWIFHHPSDDPLAGQSIPPRTKMSEEVVNRRVESDGTVRELHRIIRRPIDPLS